MSLGNDRLTEKCAVFGVYDVNGEAARVSFYGLWALQHRGQESSGIVSSDGQAMHRHAQFGLVSYVYDEKSLDKLPGQIAIGHNRYSTSGGQRLHHVQPILDNEHGFALAHNGNIPDCSQMIRFLGERGVDTRWLNDTSMMAAVIGYYMDDGLALSEAIVKAYPLFTGVFSAVAMDKTQLIAFRDKRGIRPLSIGRLDDGWVISSETCAFDTVGATFYRDVKPGEMVVIDGAGLNSIQVEKGREMVDIFEFVYFARPDSVISGLSVNQVRKELGRQMAREFKIKADIVVPVPDSGIPSALGYAEQSGIPFEMGLVKNRYIHRTFIRPTAELREHDLKMKLNPVLAAVKGQRLILVDDSVVRGTTLRKVVNMLFKAGAAEIHLAISSPPVKFPDFYGINTPDVSELIATRMSVEQIREYTGATSMNYLSLDGMIGATGRPASRFNTSCFTGKYPIPIGSRAASLKDEEPARIAIMASGEGTTAEAVIRAYAADEILGQVSLVIASRAEAGVLNRVKRLNAELGLSIKTAIIGKKTHPPEPNESVAAGQQSQSEEAAIRKLLKKEKIDLVLLLGYMRAIGPKLVHEYGWRSDFFDVFQARMLNTHPGLLPDTAGLWGIHVQKKVLASKLPHTGQTLHVVSADYDDGPMVAEHRIAVEPGETAEALSERVQRLEKQNLVIDVNAFIIERKKFLTRGGNSFV